MVVLVCSQCRSIELYTDIKGVIYCSDCGAHVDIKTCPYLTTTIKSGLS